MRVNQLVQSVGRSRPECRVLRMLYRKFSASVVGAAAVYQLTGQPRSRRATLPVRVQGGGGVGLGIEGGWDGHCGAGAHAPLLKVSRCVDLLIVVFDITSQVKHKFTLTHFSSTHADTGTGFESKPAQLIGISCFLANRFHGYLCDVHQQCRLLSYFSFMEKSRLASCDGIFLHALSSESVETYTGRAFKSAISNLPRGSTVIPSVSEDEDKEGEVGGANGGEGEGEGEEEREEGKDEDEEIAEEGEGEGGGEFVAAGTGCVERDPLDDGYWLRQVSI